MLTGAEIKRQQALGGIDIHPYNPKNVGPNSYDVSLGRHLYSVNRGVILRRGESLEDKATKEEPIDGCFLLRPNKFYLGHTGEFIGSGSFIPMYEGRSTMGRLGIATHITAGFGDIGFIGCWTLEITTQFTVEIPIGLRVGQVYFQKPTGRIDSVYDSNYNGKDTVVFPKTITYS